MVPLDVRALRSDIPSETLPHDSQRPKLPKLPVSVRPQACGLDVRACGPAPGTPTKTAEVAHDLGLHRAALESQSCQSCLGRFARWFLGPDLRTISPAFGGPAEFAKVAKDPRLPRVASRSAISPLTFRAKLGRRAPSCQSCQSCWGCFVRRFGVSTLGQPAKPPKLPTTSGYPSCLRGPSPSL